jgi:hypothetical protein
MIKFSFLFLSQLLLLSVISAQTTAKFPAPDSMTFFPLLPGSFWEYAEYQNGEKVEAGMQKDSVLSLGLTDSGYIAIVKSQIGEDYSEENTYKVDHSGKVLVLEKFGSSEIGHISPKPGMKIGDKTYTNFYTDDKKRIRLETSKYDQSSYEQQMEWQGVVFEIKIGIVSFGGAENDMRLVKYRIGKKGRIRTYP